MFSFQTTPLRFIASLLPWQTKQLAESYLFLISLHFLHFLFFFLFVVFFFFSLYIFFFLVWVEYQRPVLLVSLQLAKATQWDVIRTYVTTWQTVINSNCIGSNLKKKKCPSHSWKGVGEVKIRNVCKNPGPKNVLGQIVCTAHWDCVWRKKKFLLLCI